MPHSHGVEIIQVMHSLSQLSTCLDVPHVEARAWCVEQGLGQCLSLRLLCTTAKHVRKDNFCNLLSIAQTNYDYLAGPAAMLLLVSDCCLCSVTPARETTEFTTGVNDALCNINFLLQFPADLPYYFWVATWFMQFFSGSFLHTSQPLAIWIISETEQSAVTVEMSQSFALLSFLLYIKNMYICMNCVKWQLQVFPLKRIYVI